MSSYNAHKFAWVVNSLAPVGKHVADLHPFEFGIVDTETGKVVDPAKLGNCDYQFAIGSPNSKQKTSGTKVEKFSNKSNYDMPFTSETYRSREDVKDIRAFRPQKETAVNEYYFGFNGLDTCQSLEFECGKTYQFDVYVKGQEVRTIFGREMREVVELTTPCCAPCGTNCNTKLDCNTLTDQLVKNFNDLHWVSRFFKAEKVVKCAPALPVPTKHNCYSFRLVICDNGTERDLAKVQAQYPTDKVERISRKDSTSTYEILTFVNTLPTAYSATSTVLQDCLTCPAGFTAQPAGFAYVVEIDNTQADTTPAAQLAAAQVVFPTATFANKTQFTKGTSTYYLVSSAALTEPTGDAKIVMDLGETAGKCVSGAITTPWVAGPVKYRITRDLCLTIKNEDCTTTAGELADLISEMSGVASIVPASIVLDPASTACITRFKASQYSNCVEDGCDTYGSDGAKFEALPTFKNHAWDVCPCEGWTVNANGCPIPPTPVDRCCQCGIKFTAIRFPQDEDECVWDLFDYQFPNDVELTVSLLSPEPNTCSNPMPTWFQSGFANTDSLKGVDVVKEVIKYRMGMQAEKFAPLMDKFGFKFMQAEGLRYGVDLKGYYNLLTVSANRTFNNNYTSSMHRTRSDISLYVHEENTALFEQLKGIMASTFDKACVKELC